MIAMTHTGHLLRGYKWEKDRVEYLVYESSWNWFMRHEPFVTQKVKW